VVAAGAIEGLLAGGVDGIHLAVMHLVRGHQADPGMMVVLVVQPHDTKPTVRHSATR
jgi:hypothetical protein